LFGTFAETYKWSILQCKSKRILQRQQTLHERYNFLAKTNKESFEKGTTKSTLHIIAADIKALCPSLQRHLVIETIEDVLKKHSYYNRIV